MGMLIRRHRKGVDEVRQADTPPESLPTPEIVAGETGVPDTTSTTVPTGEVPAKPIDPEEATGDAETSSTAETPAESSEVTEDATAPARNASKQVWIDFYTATDREIVDGATRDDLAEAVLGPKG